MTDQSKIIPFNRSEDRASNDPRLKRERSEKATVDPVREKLNKQGRCDHDWCPKFARNLGDMARQLDPAAPREAARRMFREAFTQQTVDENWRKRKRYLRLQGEESDFDRHGEYVSSTKPYVHLSDAYAKLCFQADKDGPRKALRLLVKGTSLDPRPAVDVSKIDGLTQAVDCLKFVQDKCAADAEIALALSYLNKFPIAPFGANELQRDLSVGDLAGGDYFEAPGRRGKGLAIVPASTSTIAECSRRAEIESWGANQLWWYEGRVLLGYVYFPHVISRVELKLSPDECMERINAAIQAFLDPEIWHKEKIDKAAIDCVSEIITRRLEEQEIENFWPGDEYYQGSPIPELLKHTIHIRKAVYALLTHNVERIELKLEISAEPDKDGSIWEGGVEVYKCGRTPAEDEILPHGTTWDGLHGIDAWIIHDECEMDDWGLRLVKSEKEVHVIGGSCDRDYETRSYSASVDDEEIRDALFEGANRDSSFFKSVIWDDLSQLSAAPHGSIAGTILRNLALAPEDCRLDTLLFKDVHERLEGIVDFVRQELEKTTAALGERELGP